MLEFIRNYYTELQFAATFGGILLFKFVEVCYRRLPTEAGNIGRWLHNLSLTLLNFIILFYFSYFLYSSGLIDAVSPQTSLLAGLPMPLWLAVILTIFSFELLAYGFHRLMHQIPLLWRIHAVHHCDTRVDVSTAFRHHPFELMLSTLLSVFLLLWLGVPEMAAYLYTGLRILLSQFSHADIRLPEKLDRILRKVIITPDFHLMHHLTEQRYTDSNYGAISPWFDYLFGTATSMSQTELTAQRYGLEYLRKADDSHIENLLALPFTLRKDGV